MLESIIEGINAGIAESIFQGLYLILIFFTAIERLIEVRVSNRNAKWSFEQGGLEFGKEHYPFMVILHTGFLIACVVEAFLFPRPLSEPWFLTGVGMALGCQAFRWWCITSLGKQWNTRVILVPNFKRITAGPYKHFSHPNYMVVALEGLVLPLIVKAWFTAITFAILNAGLMWVRIRMEEKALQEFLKN